MSVGADGVISVASNVIPKEVAQMVRLFAAGDAKGALKIHTRFFPLFRNLFLETNPVPVKAALAMKGFVQEEYRLPLVPMQPKNREILQKTLQSCGVLK
jgi:4-hydroxy-tetrahydrodipicolinate synthase